MIGENRRELGTGDGLFAATRWSIVLGAKAEAGEALDSLGRTYRPALLGWLRCRGERPEEAEDQVHGFFAQLLQRQGLKNVAPEKGRFRTFLLTAFQNYLQDEWRRGSAQKRGGGQALASLDEVTENGGERIKPAARTESPDVAYDRAWAEALLGKALERLEQESSRTGHSKLCAALEPVLFCDDDAPAYSKIAAELGMKEATLKMAVHRMRRRLKALIREEVAQTVASEEELDQELTYLQRLFSRPEPCA